jgi:thioredoxin reductase (NADPH)
VVEGIAGENSKLKTLKVRNTQTGKTEELHPAAAFIFIGQVPNSSFLEGYAEFDPYGFILTGHDIAHGNSMLAMEPLPFESSIPGIFAAGDVRHGSIKQVASAVGEGAAASISIREFLRRSEGVTVP